MSDIISTPKTHTEALMRQNTSNQPITHNDITRTLREWCQLLNLNYLTVRMRYIRGERDTDKLLKPTPVPKKPVDTSKFAPKRQYLTNNTPPPFIAAMHMDDKLKLLRHINYDWATLDVLLTKLLTEYVAYELDASKWDE